ncbi:conserved Plasmodium protein, unknown function [Plasmodium vinckei vinckei]|uniref:Uncharacterized protein n=1 Tax=Plasmodium vinckei vinckei TaxID=54757 RepID=A0A449BV20_PLAVN|nr:conserved Plasmodium protein, unknown function [Plasmodium vinckei vinckei]KEG02676.1 hypothetical protein YYE_02506 [Plasmodium vinckei vinckei]VEV57327.1 conserved Plasmodium protein, unknown function [Plasmodium vinckei vinckei]
MSGGEVIIEKNPSSKHCVAKKELLCDSIIWELLQNYYKKAAINAWKENIVPSFVTSNSKLAKDYARVIINYMKDWFNSNECDRNVPIYILEIGAGHGKFTYLILRALSKYKKYFKSMNLPEKPFVYVFTDVAKDNITYCMNNEKLKKYINSKDNYDKTYSSKNNSYYDSENDKNEMINYDSSTNSSCCSSSYNETNYSDDKPKTYSNYSMLDFAYFDGNDTSDKIYLEITKKYIPSGTPIVLICNYVLDSLLTDAWIVNSENCTKRACLSVYSPIEEPDKTNADIMLRMSVKWDWEQIDIDEEIKKEQTNKPSDYLRKYEDIYTVLKLYSYFNQNLSFVLPVGAFILFKRILKLSDNKLLCLIGDKGYQSYEEFRGYRDPHIVVHGSLSFMVNLNAICLFFLSLGGYYIYTPYSDTFQVVTLLLHKKTNEFTIRSQIQNNNVIENGFFGKVDGNSSVEASGNVITPYDRVKNSYIIKYFKKNAKAHQKKKNSRYYSKLSNHEYDMERDLISSKLNSFNNGGETIYKKMKKINLKNLNNMSIHFGGTISSFFDNVEQIPPDILISWQKSVIHNINNHPANVSIKELIALLRYSNYDSDVFFNIRSSFTNLACYPNINGRTEKDILLDIKECYDNYYSLKGDEDIADACGHICMKFGEFNKSIYYLKESLRNFKESRHSSTYINIASCYKILRNYNKSLKYIKSAIKLSKKENNKKNKNIPTNNMNYSHDLLYNIQFCLNPIEYSIIGLNYYVQNDGLYYLSFEHKIKLKYIFLLSKEEENVLKYMHSKYNNMQYEKSNRNMDFSDIKIVKIFDNNKVVSLKQLNDQDSHKNNKHYHEELENDKNAELAQMNFYTNVECIKKNLAECLKKYNFHFGVIDCPWIIKPDIVNLMVKNSKHIITYGTLSDVPIKSSETILNYKKYSEQISWINNNYMHDECLYETREALNYIKQVTSITVTHYSYNLFNNKNKAIKNKDILTDDLCMVLSMLQIILGYHLSGLTANFLKTNKSSDGSEMDHNNGDHNEVERATSEPKINEPISDYNCLSGILTFSKKRNVSEEDGMEICGNYLIMNNKNEEFITKINIIGIFGSICLKKTLSNWNIHIVNINGETIFDKSGRIATNQNANDVFISQYLIKTNGKLNNIKHYSEYYSKDDTPINNNEPFDSDMDILVLTSDDENSDAHLKENFVNTTLDTTKEPSEDNSDNENKDFYFTDFNLEIMKDLPGKRFYSPGKGAYENINFDKDLIDITVNNNTFYSRIIEGINMSYDQKGAMINFKYNPNANP